MSSDTSFSEACAQLSRATDSPPEQRTDNPFLCPVWKQGTTRALQEAAKPIGEKHS